MSSIASRLCKFSALVLAAACGLAACAKNKTHTGPAPVDLSDIMAAKLHPALLGTIAQYAVLADAAPLPVEGYGIVAELPHTGSGDMQPNIKSILIEELQRAKAGSFIYGTQNINPDRILASDLIAAVEVRGAIPPLARQGDRFDIVINTVANSQATSIANGLLWTSELKIIGFTADTGADTHTIAFGRGPVFIPKLIDQILDPKTADAASSRKALRSGRVIGGGIVAEDRAIRLQLFSPSAGRTRAIERAINSRFPGVRDKVASADGDTFISLTIPPEFNSSPAAFIDVVKHMYLQQEIPGFSERKATELIAALANPKAPHRELSLGLQGLGRSIIPDYLEPQYTSPNPLVRFWAARAGAALLDVGGIVVLQQFVADEKNPLHDQAVQAIAEVSRDNDTVRATISFMELLKSPKTEERIAAYQGLLSINSGAIHSYNLGRKMYLDIIPSDSPPLIYVSQSIVPRIALIGRPIVLAPETLYISPDNLLTVSVPGDNPQPAAASEGGSNIVTAAVVGQPDQASGSDASAAKENVVLYWRSPMGTPPVTLTTNAKLSFILSRLAYAPDPLSPAYDPKTVFIGASYQRMVEMLASLTKNKILDAQFIMQKSPDLQLTPNDVINTRPEGLVHSAPETAPDLTPGPTNANIGTSKFQVQSGNTPIFPTK